jgi:hypothetical protein
MLGSIFTCFSFYWIIFVNKIIYFPGVEPTTFSDRPKRQASLNAQKFFDDLEGSSDEIAIDSQSDYLPESGQHFKDAINDHNNRMVT